MQQLLFEKKPISPKVEKMIGEMYSDNPEQAICVFKERGVPEYLSIYFILIQNFETDWDKIIDHFEATGFIEFFNIILFGEQFRLTEANGSFIFNDSVILEVDGDCKYDEKMITRVKSALKKFICGNKYYFGIVKTK